jgi:hypothetical protein
MFTIKEQSMETVLRSNEQKAPSLKRFVWGNIFALCAIIVVYIGVTVYVVYSSFQSIQTGSFLLEVVIITSPIVVAQSYCLALVRLRSATNRRVLAEVFIFQITLFFALVILSVILTTLWPDTFSTEQPLIFYQGYLIDSLFSAIPIIMIVYVISAIIFSGAVTGCALLAAPWHDMQVEPISRRQLLLTFGALFGSAIALGLLWLAWMPGIVNQTSGDSTFAIWLVLLLFLPAIMLVAIGGVATWRSLALR